MRCRSLTIGAALLAAAVSPVSAQQFEPSMTGLAASLERAMSGLRIDTRQHSVGSEQVSTSASASSMALSNVIVENEQQVALRNAVGRFESMQNEVSGLCASVEMQRQARTASNVNQNLSASFADHERHWLSVGGDRSSVLAQTQNIRRSAFCTESERRAGLCLPGADNSMGGMPAADSSADSWLLIREYGSGELGYGSVFIDTIAPFPTISTTSDASADVQGLIERAAARREMALIAIARGGLSDVLLRGLEGGLE